MLDHQIEGQAVPRSAAVVRLAVIEMDGAWRLFMDGERVGRFPVHKDAVGCAMDMAREMRGTGLQVEVLDQDRFGELALTEGPSFRPSSHLRLVRS
jgi:hypothetical protein